MKSDKLSIYLFIFGLFLIGFTYFIPSEQAIDFVNQSLRAGKALNEDLVFWIQDLQAKGLTLGTFLCLLGLGRYFLGDKFRQILHTGEEAGLPSISKKTGGRSAALDLFLISLIMLFAELLIIRWLAVEMRIFAYFKNVPLISCFMGIGLGAALGEKPNKLRYYSFPFWFALFAVVVVFLGPRLVFLNPAGSEDYIWGIGRTHSMGTQVVATFFFIATIIFIFIWNTRVFMTVGYMMGRLLRNFKPLTAYSINIFGSLMGIWLFAIVCYFSAPPVVWFAVVLLGFLVFLRQDRRKFIAMLCVGILFLGYLVTRQEPNQVFWSPYYKIRLIEKFIDSKSTNKPISMGYALHVNEDSHQTGMNYSEAFIKNHFQEEDFQKPSILELPYRIRKPEKVLIVGAGMGNDAAAAVRAGVPHVDAVEIDPMILDLGHRFHPEKPYASSHVRTINDDARAFFKKTKEKYDLVVFGILDSHTQFSSLSNLRLDNYVYTVESLRDAKALLNPGGIISITFGGDAQNYWMGARFYRMLEDVFGRAPIALQTDRTTFITGENLDPSELARNRYWRAFYPKNIVTFEDASKTIPATDDWPFLYLKDRRIPKMYFVMMVMLCVVCWRFLRKYLGEQKSLNGHFFLMGAAFLLLETKAISELALVFGTTWLVNAVVFSGIMILILLANWAVMRFKVRRVAPMYACLGATLIASYLLNIAAFAGLSFGLKMLLSTVVVLLPVFFASMIFAVSFSKATHVPSAFGSNLIGAVIGGFLEYTSLITGIRFLALLALVIYALSFMALKKDWKLAF